MFADLPKAFNEYGLRTDVRTLLILQKAMGKSLVHTLGDLFQVLKSIVVKDQKMLGPFSRAFYNYFLKIDIRPGEKLDDAVERSDAFNEWRTQRLEDHPDWKDLDLTTLINKYLNEVHVTSYDIKKIIDGNEILAKDDPSMKDRPSAAGGTPSNILDRAADYRDVDMDELMRRLEEVSRQQNEAHSGGSHWIGTGGISPYGNGGAAFGGIRVGGKGGGKMARRVVDDARYYPVDLDAQLRDDNIDAALAALNGIQEESAHKFLDVPITIQEGLKQGGLFIPIEKDKIEEKMQVILLIDNGGYSMDPFIFAVMELFKKMKTRFAHDLEVYYFHNTIYDVVYTDDQRRKPIPIDQFLSKDPSYRVFIVGDAAMAPYELTRYSINSWTQIKEKYKKIAWLNPMYKRSWDFTLTTRVLEELIPMYELTPRGIDQAIRAMNKIKKGDRKY